MEMSNELLPMLMYSLICALIVFIIVFVYKLIVMLNKTNTLLDDVIVKVHKLDNLFEVIDKSTSTINSVTNRVSEGVLKFLFKIFKKRKDDFDE